MTFSNIFKKQDNNVFSRLLLDSKHIFINDFKDPHQTYCQLVHLQFPTQL